MTIRGISQEGIRFLILDDGILTAAVIPAPGQEQNTALYLSQDVSELVFVGALSSSKTIVIFKHTKKANYYCIVIDRSGNELSCGTEKKVHPKNPMVERKRS